VTSYDVVSRVTETDGEELWPVYLAVFGEPGDYGDWRGEIWNRHAARAGFRLVRAWDDDAGRRLVGFGYGYTGERGQWWTDQVAAVLEPASGCCPKSVGAGSGPS
jgi:hypothetical protein